MANATILNKLKNNSTKIEIGKYVSFGNYYQENENSKDPIEWLVLDVDTENKKALLISRYALDSKPYHETLTSITWEECSLRKWLNSEFLKQAFSEVEQKYIINLY